MNIVRSMSIRRKTDIPRNRAQVIIMNAMAILSETFSNAAQRSITFIITKAGRRERAYQIFLYAL